VKWYAGADHAGYALKGALIGTLRALGDEVVDLGTASDASVDYPDYAERVARAVAENRDGYGLLVCGTGIGMAIAANKVAGVRAAVVTDPFTAEMARAHNDANVLALGARVTSPEVAEQATQVFRATEFAGGRHDARVKKINALDDV
jgi:ribose 5-phosphate isomerase B